MRIVFFGSGEFGCPTLRALINDGFDVARVVTQPARGSGRGRKLSFTPIHTLARQLDCAVDEVADVNQPDIVESLRADSAKIAVVVAFGQKLKAPIRSAFEFGCVNLHASLLPRYRGAAPIHWAIVNGEARTGVTVFELVDRMDAGPIFSTRETAIEPDETAGELHDRLSVLGVEAVMETLRLFDRPSRPVGTAQDDALATRAPKLSKQDGYIHVDIPAEQFARTVRGLSPWPGVTMQFVRQDSFTEPVVLLRARALDGVAVTDPPGTLIERLHLAVRDGAVELLEVKPASGRTMSWTDFVNGRRVTQGDRFEPMDPAR